jgi:hypothetical protein
MAVWHIVVLYLAVFALLQFAVYRYLRGNDDGRATGLGTASNTESGGFDDRRADPAGPHEPRDVHEGRSEPDDGDDVRFCPECGARNEAGAEFTYCHNCVSPLGR